MTETGLADGRSATEPVAVGPGDGGSGERDAIVVDEIGADDATQGGNGAAGDATPAPVLAAADASLLALVDRLTAVLERSDLGELEVAAGGTTIVLRAPSAVERPVAVAMAGPAEAPPAPGRDAQAGQAAAPASPAPAPAEAKPSVKAPLTGIFYAAPSPGATPYVAIGDHVAVGQIIGLIEAMKLFNEIKSDMAGRVTRVCVDTGALVKAKQPLIEVEPR